MLKRSELSHYEIIVQWADGSVTKHREREWYFVEETAFAKMEAGAVEITAYTYKIGNDEPVDRCYIL